MKLRKTTFRTLCYFSNHIVLTRICNFISYSLLPSLLLHRFVFMPVAFYFNFFCFLLFVRCSASNCIKANKYYRKNNERWWQRRRRRRQHYAIWSKLNKKETCGRVRVSKQERKREERYMQYSPTQSYVIFFLLFSCATQYQYTSIIIFNSR